MYQADIVIRGDPTIPEAITAFGYVILEVRVFYGLDIERVVKLEGVCFVEHSFDRNRHALEQCKPVREDDVDAGFPDRSILRDKQIVGKLSSAARHMMLTEPM